MESLNEPSSSETSYVRKVQQATNELRHIANACDCSCERLGTLASLS